jgi:hypothetical protein
LVGHGLLIKDYFILTTTRRPIQCFAKVLPAHDTDRTIITNKLQLYNIQLSDYIDISQSVGIESYSKLSHIGEQLFTKIPYSSIFDITLTSSSTLLTTSSSNQLSPSNNNLSITSQATTQAILNNQLIDPSSFIRSVRFPQKFYQMKKHQNKIFVFFFSIELKLK